MEAADRVAAGQPLSPALDLALLRGSSVGGARPKAMLTGDHGGLIAKFSTVTDPYGIVSGEFVAMELARRAGLNVATVRLERAMGRDVLLVDRFDRTTATGHRRALVSALTILQLDEMMARYASYADLAQIVRERFTAARETLRELFARITFNILSGNSDDHARNHSAFWDGSWLTLTPAYDICPQPRAGGETSQAMMIGSDGFRMSQIAGCVQRSQTYMLSESEARELVDHQVEVIRRDWDAVCDLAEMAEIDRAYFWRRQFLNPYALEGYTASF
jgi:serine/threonine-protein kinase HipA